MRWTNKFNLPKPLALACAGDDHWQAGKYSVTQLSKSPRQLMLARRHEAEMVEDVSDRLWSVMGQAVHAVIEKAGGWDFADLRPDGTFTVNRAERKLPVYQEFRLMHDFGGGLTLSGTADFYDPVEKELHDWKMTSVYSFLAGGREEWTEQANVYSWLLALDGVSVTRSYCFLLLRDWSARDYGIDAKKDKPRGYPPIPFVRVENELWPKENQGHFIRTAISRLEAAGDLADDALPGCSEEYTWRGKRCERYCSSAPRCSQVKGT